LAISTLVLLLVGAKYMFRNFDHEWTKRIHNWKYFSLAKTMIKRNLLPYMFMCDAAYLVPPWVYSLFKNKK
jgi:hypothetical protein